MVIRFRPLTPYEYEAWIVEILVTTEILTSSRYLGQAWVRTWVGG